jgi:hypothetical protein
MNYSQLFPVFSRYRFSLGRIVGGSIRHLALAIACRTLYVPPWEADESLVDYFSTPKASTGKALGAPMLGQRLVEAFLFLTGIAQAAMNTGLVNGSAIPAASWTS